MATSSFSKIDFAELSERLQSQFRGLDPKDPSVWPAAPRFLVYLLIALAVVGVAWYVWLSDFQTQLDEEVAKETVLRHDYEVKMAKAINLQALKTQREQIRVYVNQLEKQLPSKAEMDALLSDINQAGLGRSLQFELFRPGNVQVRDYYAELPIQVRVTGRYHDMGAFTADVAHLSRIVTLDNLSITPTKEGLLAMDVTARTFRYLDQEEIEAQRKAAAGAKK
ncbi:type 4a pilus biogenesis protein PilO [Xylophilus rhododendri]|uniref:Type 4a pilus biogenesis protein PilO n=1 Tax=Xylophilus rhododendri TaxID=2697032 RepID=A0A857J5D5_9BURK|nr:type 4a pilus biogenesis protein PilO [Xylophilus rhododendri]QHI98221.1 type 4a pilus biogenesis protein PilO [Xylophilus rhododendri]